MDVVWDETKGWVSRANADIAAGAVFTELAELEADCTPQGKDYKYLQWVNMQATHTCPPEQRATPLSWYFEKHLWSDRSGWDEEFCAHVITRLVLTCRLLKHPFVKPLHYNSAELEEGLGWNVALNRPAYLHRIHTWLITSKWLSSNFSAEDVGRAYPQVLGNQRIAWTYDGSKAHILLFAEHARLSHSCLPNCHSFVRVEAAAATGAARKCRMVVVAVQDIPAGHELTIAYDRMSSLPLSWLRRRQFLLERSNFVCACSVCEQGLDLPQDKLNELIRSSEVAEAKHGASL